MLQNHANTKHRYYNTVLIASNIRCWRFQGDSEIVVLSVVLFAQALNWRDFHGSRPHQSITDAAALRLMTARDRNIRKKRYLEVPVDEAK